MQADPPSATPADAAPRPRRFDAFMRAALFDPRGGYYSRRVQDVGSAGDFATAPTLSPMLGAAVARWLRDGDPVRDVIEAGAGNGMLLARVARECGWWRRRGFRWHIVEASAGLRERQRQTLRGLRVRWWDTMEQALAACDGAARIFHNELLDAFPCRVLRWSGGGWEELHLTRDPGGPWREVFFPVNEAPESSALRQEWPGATGLPAEGQRVEVHESAHAWLQGWAPQWRAGAMLTIDYGAHFPGIYHRRPQGTLRAYLRHQRLTGPAVYENAGHQDITADINFTDINQWTAQLGWSVARDEVMSEFLSRHGARPRTATDRQLLESGAAEAFRVIEHRPG
jgi:SAM-dependent MidA family methyltransferase